MWKIFVFFSNKIYIHKTLEINDSYQYTRTTPPVIKTRSQSNVPDNAQLPSALSVKE